MSKEASNPLVDLSELSKPAVVLVEKLSEGVGGLAAPWQIKRVAKAKIDAANSAAEVARIEVHSDIEIADLHQRAEQRRIKENMRHQKNMEDIIAQAVPDVNETAKPDAMEDDWITNFFNKCRMVSDSEMQSLWARVLAGEANAPGTYSKRTVNFISELDKSDAELFTKLCGFGWIIRSYVPLVFDEKVEIYNRHGIYFNTLIHLESIGLIQYSGPSDFVELKLPKKFVVHYYGRWLRLEMPGETDNQLEVGKILLTKIGQELAPICGSKPVDGFYDYVKDQWKQYLPEVKNAERKE